MRYGAGIWLNFMHYTESEGSILLRFSEGHKGGQ